MKITRWTPADLTQLELVEDLSDGDVVTISIATPIGDLVIMAEVDIERRTLHARAAHIQSAGGPTAIGVANLRVVADFVLTRMDCDEAIVEGASRTTGAQRGRRPAPLRFIRRSGTAPGA